MYKDYNDPRKRESQKRHYEKNKDEYKQRAVERKKKITEFINSFKNKPCTDCEVQYPHYVMDFDHIEPEQKITKISSLKNRGNLKLIEDEISKCELVCANCHRERTQQRLVQ